MSGFISIFHLNGTPVETAELERPMQRLAYRGRDGATVWTEGPVGMGHALTRLRSGELLKGERQPFSSEGIMVVSAGRIDDQQTLSSALKQQGRDVAPGASVADFLLNAYLAWGAEFPRHILGNYSFVLWDSRQSLMVAARDHMGQQPIYYAHVGDFLLVSNELTALRCHAAVSSELDPLAVADFLMLVMPYAHDRTFSIFRDIRRLPAAHILTARLDAANNVSTVETRRYWKLPTDQKMIRYRTEGEYLEHYRHVLRLAVKDRMHTEKVVISLSGGVDSSNIAATAVELIQTGQVNAELAGMTGVFNHVHPDTEHYYSSIVARYLKIPQHVVHLDNHLFVQPLSLTAEPAYTIHTGYFEAGGRLMGQLGSVSLSGQGADEVFLETPLYDSLRGMPFPKAVEYYAWLWRYLKHRPPLWGLLPRLNPRRWLRKQTPNNFGFPEWLNPDFSAKYHLHERWNEVWNPPTGATHPVNPGAYDAILWPEWNTRVEMLKPIDFMPPISTYVFLDLRMIDFALSLPSYPWFQRKYIERRAMQGRLPAATLKRPKTGVGETLRSLLEHPSAAWVDQYVFSERIKPYVQTGSIPPLTADGISNAERYVNIRPLLFDVWLNAAQALY
jgi:asparagine synthase (glutamine-hydrolysing)